jgi:uncharacterized OB-fold protein
MPARRFCVACGLVETQAATLRPTGTLLSRSLLHRAGKDVVTVLPSPIALVQESNEGATFCAPVEGDLSGLAAGARVALRTKSWPLPDGSRFEVIVVAAEEVES